MANVKIDVAYYDDEEREAFANNYPNDIEGLDEIVQSGIGVPFENFKIYSQLHHLNPTTSLGTLESITRNVDGHYFDTGHYTQFDEATGKLTALLDHSNEQDHVTKSIGSAGILSLLDSLEGTTSADWQRIDIQGHADLDFVSGVSREGDKLIAVEAKGSIRANNQLKSNLNSKRLAIKNKKAQSDYSRENQDGADLLIGGITVADKVNDLKLWLVDPPIQSTLSNEQRLRIKLLKRLTYYFRIIFDISKRSFFSFLLANRLRALEELDDPFRLNNLSLVDSEFNNKEVDTSFLRRYSQVNGDIIGNIIQISETEALFIGLKKDIVDLVVAQKFNLILRYQAEPEEIVATIKSRLALSRLTTKFLKDLNSDSDLRKSRLARFEIPKSKITIGSSGVAFSFLTVNDFELISTK